MMNALRAFMIHSLREFEKPVLRQLVEDAANQILSLKKTIEVQKARMVADCSVSEVELIKTFKGLDPAAPISRRQNQKRLERKEPHFRFIRVLQRPSPDLNLGITSIPKFLLDFKQINVAL